MGAPLLGSDPIARGVACWLRHNLKVSLHRNFVVVRSSPTYLVCSSGITCCAGKPTLKLRFLVPHCAAPCASSRKSEFLKPP